MPSAPLAYLTSPTGFEWLDLAAPAGAAVLYFVCALIWPPIVRPLWRLIAHTIYRLRIFDRDNVPRSGPVLFVCNHVSYVDWMLLWAASPRRMRFVAWAGWNRNPLLRLFLRVTNSIPIDGEAGPKAIVAALRKVSDALDRGEAICIFPEARLTRTGAMLPFHRGFERILKQTKAAAAVVPVCISQIWGSIFSYRGGRLIWKWPERIPYPVAVTFGAPLPMTVQAPEVRQRIQELSAETAIRDSDRSRPVHRHFVRVAAQLRQLFRPCLIDTNGPKPRILSYAKALVGVICISRWLKPKIGSEQNVGVWLPPSVGGAIANISLAILGRTSVNLNYTSSAESIRSAIEQTGLNAIITSKRFLARMPLAAGSDVTLVHLEDAAAAITARRRLRALLMVFLLPGWMLDRWVLRMGRHTLDDIATIIFSSGSTGDPKGVMLSHRNIACNAESMVAHVDVDHHDRLLCVLPLFHSFGYTVTMWMPLLIGGSAVYHADPRQAKEIGELCKKFHCTILLSTATFLRFYLRRCEPDDFKSLRLLVCGAEKLPPALAKEFASKFGVLPTEGYGVTELAPVIAAGLPDRAIYGMKQLANKFGSVGQPVAGVAVRIVDPDTLQPLPQGSDGIIMVKGGNVMAGYLNQPDLTKNAIVDGWYNTGDMGRVDEDGFLTITGRLSRFAKIGGEMAPLEKIEEEMHAVLGTNDRVLAVAAIPDEKRGERLIVLYLPAMSMPVGDLTTKLAARGMQSLWIPSDRDFHQVDEIPALGAGKLDLRKVKELALQVARKT